MRFDVIQFKNHALVFVRSSGPFRADDSRAFLEFLTSLEIWRAGASVLSDLRGIDATELAAHRATGPDCAPLGNDPHTAKSGRSRRIALVSNQTSRPVWTEWHSEWLRGTGVLTEAFDHAEVALRWLDVQDETVAHRITTPDPGQPQPDAPSLRITLSTA